MALTKLREIASTTAHTVVNFTPFTRKTRTHARDTTSHEKMMALTGDLRASHRAEYAVGGGGMLLNGAHAALTSDDINHEMFVLELAKEETFFHDEEDILELD